MGAQSVVRIHTVVVEDEERGSAKCIGEGNERDSQ